MRVMQKLVCVSGKVMLMRLSLAVVMVCLAAACSDAEPLEIVSDGVGHATVVVAANDKDATTAAREIQTFVEKHDPCDSGEATR